MSQPTVRERLSAFLAACVIGDGDEAERMGRAFRDHLAALDIAALNDEAAARWRSILRTCFGASPGGTAALQAAADAIAGWPQDERDRFLTDIGYLRVRRP